MKVTVRCCQRCGQDHIDLEFKDISNPSDEWKFWAMCPLLSQPILLKVEKDLNWISNFKSSNVSGFGYDASRLLLTIEFGEGSRYEYQDVPPHIFEELKEATSKGVYIAAIIKKKYKAKKIEK